MVDRHRVLVPVLAACIVVSSLPIPAAPSRTIHVPAGVRVYAALIEKVSGRRRSGVTEGQPVHCRVWRDVVVDGAVVIKAGTPLLARVERVKHASIAGVKGKLVLAALETRAVDGQTIQLEGGYHKEGKSRMALSITLGAVVFLPLIFISGRPAELPRGTVFDTYVSVPVTVKLDDAGDEAAVPVISLAGIEGSFSAEVDLQKLQDARHPKVFHIWLQGDVRPEDGFAIDRVNDQEIPSIPLKVIDSSERDGETALLATVPIRALAKHFSKGINTFHVARTRGKEVERQEIVLNIQF